MAAELTADELYENLRIRIVGELHVGLLADGARLTPIRELARSTGLDHRVVAEVYQRLDEEGLVEVRGRSGVYVRCDGPAEPTDKLVRWCASVLAEHWARAPAPLHFADLIRRAVEPGVRCMCVESTEDHEVAFNAELRERFGVSVRSVRLRNGNELCSDDVQRLRWEVASCDFAVTSVFHSAAVRKALEGSDRPLIALSVNPDFAGALASRLQAGGLTVVVADPRFGQRAETFLADHAAAGRFEVIAWDDPRVKRVDPADNAVLFTRAARRRLAMPDLHFTDTISPFISCASAREIAAVIVAANLRRSTRAPSRARPFPA